MKILTTMKFKNLFILFINLFDNISTFQFHNNACSRWEDYPIWYLSSNCKFNANVMSDTATIIRRNGYVYEGHTVATGDGYLLNLQRITPAANDFRRHKQPIFIQHGLITNSAIWVDKGNRSLGFYLADMGYDVWLGNVRGTTYSKRHTNLTLDDPKFWNFTLDAMAKYDISDQLKFIANKTGKAGSIIYIGHSMGTTLGFMYASSNEREAHSLLRGIIALAPVAYLDDIPLVKTTVKLAPQIEDALQSRGIEALFYQKRIPYLTNYACTFAPTLCRKTVEVFAGHMSDQFQPEDLLLFYSNWLAGTSVAVLKHYKQIAETGRFAHFDFGEKNADVYRQLRPPLYDLEKIKLPVYLFYGKNDLIATESNVNRVMDELGSVKKIIRRIPRNNDKYSFNHVEFLYAKDLEEFLYKDLNTIITEELRAK